MNPASVVRLVPVDYELGTLNSYSVTVSDYCRLQYA